MLLPFPVLEGLGWGWLAQLLLNAGRRKGWIPADCALVQIVYQALKTTLILLILKVQVWAQPVWLLLLSPVAQQCLVLQLKRAPWRCCGSECHNQFGAAESSGDTPILLLHNWNTLPARSFNGMFGS